MKRIRTGSTVRSSRRPGGVSGRSAPVWNPATGERQAAVDLACAEEVDRAVEAAAAAFPAWRATGLARRAEIMFAGPRDPLRARSADRPPGLRRAREGTADALGEVARGLENERVPSAAMLPAGLLRRAGPPDGCLNIVHGDRTAVERILEHPGIAAGPTDDPGAQMGPLITAEHRARVADFLEEAATEGATVVIAGRRDLPPAGFFLRPGLIDHVKPGPPRRLLGRPGLPAHPLISPRRRSPGRTSGTPRRRSPRAPR